MSKPVTINTLIAYGKNIIILGSLMWAIFLWYDSGEDHKKDYKEFKKSMVQDKKDFKLGLTIINGKIRNMNMAGDSLRMFKKRFERSEKRSYNDSINIVNLWNKAYGIN